MLQQLSISNYALIDQTKIEFDRGMSVITGETGAGKSILLGALGLILGQRADAQTLLDKEKKCVVEGTFDLSEHNLKSLFDENDVDFEPQTIIRREILPNGKSRAFVNDTPANASFLKSIASYIIDVHSQHQNLLLGDDSYQMMIIDTVANNQSIKEEYAVAYRKYRDLKKREENLVIENDKMKADLDYITFQHKQLEEAKLKDGELQELETELQSLTHAEEIKTTLTQAIDTLDTCETPMLQQLSTLIHSISKIESFLPESINATKRLETAKIDLADLCNSLVKISEATEHDPERILFVQQRIDNIYMLMQKHKKQDVSELIAYKNELNEQLKHILCFDEDLEELRKEIEVSTKELTVKAKTLTKSRQATFAGITSFITARLKELGMPNANFSIRHTTAEKFSVSGNDIIDMLFAANKNGKPADITKVASGGEMSRVMLSIKSLLSSSKGLPTIIFDEIDTGVSGEIADKMGHIMTEMAKNMQVIAITHLPQVAAKGAKHYKVYKTDTEERTISNITLLDSDARITEIAKMLSGASISEAAIMNAKDLLGK